MLLPRLPAVLLAALVGSGALSSIVSAPIARAQVDDLLHLETGFAPDPIELEGTTNGGRPAVELAPQCTGFVGSEPSHVLALDSRFGFLRIFATGVGDLVIAVRTSDDRWLCSEDRYGPHPSIEGLFPPGRIEIWVGVETADAEASPYTVRLTEARSVRPGVGSDLSTDESVALARDLGLEVEATEGLHQPIRLRRGFLPDPRWLDGVGGGSIDAGGLGGTCRGRVTARPTHIITVLVDFDFLQLYLEARGEPTLIVLTPDGRFLCDVGIEDTVAVSDDAWPIGVYRVWVGLPGPETDQGSDTTEAQADATLRHRLGISEIRRVR